MRDDVLRLHRVARDVSMHVQRSTYATAFSLLLSGGGVIFAILVVGVVGVILDAGFNKLAGFVTYQE